MAMPVGPGVLVALMQLQLVRAPISLAVATGLPMATLMQLHEVVAQPSRQKCWLAMLSPRNSSANQERQCSARRLQSMPLSASTMHPSQLIYRVSMLHVSELVPKLQSGRCTAMCFRFSTSSACMRRTRISSLKMIHTLGIPSTCACWCTDVLLRVPAHTAPPTPYNMHSSMKERSGPCWTSAASCMTNGRSRWQDCRNTPRAPGVLHGHRAGTGPA